MKVQFLPVNFQNVITRIVKRFSFSIPADTFSMSKRNVYQKLVSVSGGYSKEDLKAVDKLVKKLNGKDLDSLKQRYIDECLKLAQNREEFTPSIQKKIKKDNLVLYAINKIKNKDNPNLAPTPYYNWFDTDYALQNPILKGSMYVHPKDKILNLTGEFNTRDLLSIKKEEKKYNKFQIEDILLKKSEIFDRMNAFLLRKDADFAGGFSDKEFCRMKKLAVSYEALNNLQKQKGVFTKDLEALCFAPAVSNKQGDYINGLGLVIDNVSVNTKDGRNIPAIVLFSDFGKSHNIMVYDVSKLKNKSFNFPPSFNKEELNELNEGAKNRILSEEDALISGIQFSVLNTRESKNWIEKNNVVNDSTVNEIVANSKYYTYINSFFNNKPEVYNNAGKIAGYELMKLLVKKDCAPVFVKALGYNGVKKPPYLMYLRYGFKPFSHNINNLPKDSHEPVYMYLKDFEDLKKRLSVYETLYHRPKTGGG